VPPAPLDRLFVYGTLRSGQSSRRMLDDYVRTSQPAHCRGTLYAFASGYPGMVLDGDTVIVGELVELDDLDKALRLLDAYEGEDFTRIQCDVEGGGGIERAWIYVLADPASAMEATLIPGGDWTALSAAEVPDERE
jgi:gamma-glutamylcyclotransferase (GGCT)/AIG2-like uncharacterized protein YtfP